MSNLTDLVVHNQENPTQNPVVRRSLQLTAKSAPCLNLTAIPAIENNFTPLNTTSLAKHTFAITKTPLPDHKITATFQQNLMSNKNPNRAFPAYLVFQDKNQDEDEEFVSKGLIRTWNAEIGNSRNQEKARKLIDKMRIKGGLTPLGSPFETPLDSPVDIPSARIGLCLLAGLNNQENKINALNSLLEILKNDDYKKSNSNSLVSLATELLKLMAREVIQAVDVEAQNKLAEVYNILAETLHHHFGKHHINGITDELKEQLVQATKSLDKLNRLEDARLKFNVSCALEGIRRLKDDKQQLFDIVERIYKLASAGYTIYRQAQHDGFERLESAFKGLDPHVHQSWYTAILIIKNLAKDIKDDPEQLTPLLMLINTKSRQFNWKFTYAAVEILFDIALNGANERVRLRAFNGIKPLGSNFPGLAYFADCHRLKPYSTFKPVVHFKMPRNVDPNIRIRQACAEALIELAKNSQDLVIQNKARSLLRARAAIEKNPSLLALLRNSDSL